MTRIPYTHLRSKIGFTRSLAGYDLALKNHPDFTALLHQLADEPDYAVMRHAVYGAFFVIDAQFIAQYQPHTLIQTYPFWTGARFAAERLQKGI